MCMARIRKQTKLKQTKLTITIREDVLRDLNAFVGECENSTINKSSVIQDVLYYALKEDKAILEKLFPLDKRYKK